MSTWLLWLLGLEIIGFIVFPITYRIFRFFPDKGWTFSKPLGLLLVSYGTWLSGYGNLIANSRWSVLLALLVLTLVACLVLKRDFPQIKEFLKLQWRWVLAAEIVFIVAFALWALFRAHIPEIRNTEQPMDFMFLNSLVASPHFPPVDAWFSGHSISYYYFGYLMVAVNALLTGADTPVAFNLGLATTASMAILAGYGLVRNLVLMSGGSKYAAAIAGFTGAFLIVLASNLVGFLELFRTFGLGSKQFWEFIAVEGLSASQHGKFQMVPGDFWWWWHASRIIPGTINEFPMFSLIVGDMHPHLMAIPFVLLVTALSVQLYCAPRQSGTHWIYDNWQLFLVSALALGVLVPLNMWDFPMGLAVLGSAIILGSLRIGGFGRPFANGTIAGNEPGDTGRLAHLQRESWFRSLLGAMIVVIALAVLAVILFAPFYFTFDGNANGIFPEREQLSNPKHLFLIWGVSALLGGLLTFHVAKIARIFEAVHGSTLAIAFAIGFSPLALWLQPIWMIPFYFFGVLFWTAYRITNQTSELIRQHPLLNILFRGVTLATFAIAFIIFLADGLAHSYAGVPGTASLLSRLLIIVPLSMFLVLIIYLCISLSIRQNFEEKALEIVLMPLVLLAIALALIIGVELFYISDMFGGSLHRMNTVFKLYYQAWILLGIVGAYALWYVHAHLMKLGTFSRRLVKPLWIISIFAVITLAYYPFASAYTRAESNGGLESPTLDGQAYLLRESPDESKVIEWIKKSTDPTAVILESPTVPCANDPERKCSSWTEAGRISGSTGRPTILGWEGHERQWRRNHGLISERKRDAQNIYQTEDLNQARKLLSQYDVNYVIVGPRERAAYGPSGMEKFRKLGKRVFPNKEQANANFVIYFMPTQESNN